VKARVVNLKSIKPEVTQEDICREIAVEFALEYLEDPATSLEERVIDDDHIDSIEACRTIKSSMTDPEFLYGKSSEFSNSFEKRFDWGVVDFNADVRSGVIEQCKIYSDSLFPDLIDALQAEFAKGVYRYQRRQIDEIRDNVLGATGGDKAMGEALEEVCEWIKEMIE
jgi:lipoate-protein ligase A